MEKIMLALDAHQLNISTVDFACYIARLTRSKLTGVFLEGVNPEDYGYIPGSGDASYEDGGKDLTEQQVTKTIEQFRESCICRETSNLVHRDRGMPLSEVLEESRFADLIIVDPSTSFSRSDRGIPSGFVKDVLEGSECPVLVAPYSFSAIEEIILTYDGSESSVFAIKQFAHLFPGLTDKKVVVVSVRDLEGGSLEQQYKIKEWLKAHYPQAEFVVLNGNASDELFGYLIEKKNA
ncbi:MAG: universal stress protein, partial [Bacteroidetes bacterium]|nr:universal stress protein [Bacteroidota bacterium]